MIIMLANNETLFWNVNSQTRELFELINGLYLATIVSTLGIVGNVINIIVFYHQGLRTSVNISFASLATSDLCSLVTLLWYNICGAPAIIHADILFSFAEVKHLTAGFPHGCFSRISAWITVFIMAERCLCVACPFKVNKFITPARTICIIISINLIMVLSLVPMYTTQYLDWKFYPSLNKSIIGLVTSGRRPDLEDISSSLFSGYMIATLFAIPVLTSLLLVLYRSKSKWRLRHIQGANNKHNITRDKTLIKIVLAEGFIFTCSYILSAAVLILMIIEPEFNFDGKLSNLFFVYFSFTFLFDATNSSLHFIVFLAISSNFRDAFFEVFSTFSSFQKTKKY